MRASPLHAPYLADECVVQRAPLIFRERLARDTYLVRLPIAELARRARPGQFVMVRVPNSLEPLLGRAFAFFDIIRDASGEPIAFDIAFHVVGKLTRFLARCPLGEELEIWGPLGNGFLPIPAQHLVMVAGGIGQTPFLMLAQEVLHRQQFARDVPRIDQVTLCFGARSHDLIAAIDRFREIGVTVRLATDDGSAGHPGLVTDLLEEELAGRGSGSIRVVCCGPERMMERVGALCESHGVSCQVSLETPMACGLGICFSCVTRIRQVVADGGESWDYKRTCVEGPVFDSKEVFWSH